MDGPAYGSKILSQVICAAARRPSRRPRPPRSFDAAARRSAGRHRGDCGRSRTRAASATSQPPNPDRPLAGRRTTDAAQAAPAAPLKPHKQANLPPLPFQAYAPPRPPDVVRAAYVFAAEHPEILSYVPCFCGCERAGHKGNEDCFVARRDGAGDVVEWEPHGLDCAVCLDVARDAQQMYSSGASVARHPRGHREEVVQRRSARHAHADAEPPKQSP